MKINWMNRASVATLTAICLATGASVAAGAIEADFSDQGIASLKWAGTDMLKQGRPEVASVVFESKTLNDQGVYEYEFERVEGNELKVRFDPRKKVLTHTYGWGSIAWAYDVNGDRLDMAVTIANNTRRTIADFQITPLTLALPEAVDTPKRWRRQVTLPGDFSVVEAGFGDRKLLLGCPTVMPLRFGFGKPADKKKTLPVTFSGGVHMLEPGAVMYHHLGLPRIAPGQSLTIRLSLRFAEAEADTSRWRAKMVEAFRDYHQPRMVWKDRRPIGAIFIGSGRGPANNPRNWFKDKDLDVRTEEGRAELHKRMMQHAERCIQTLKATNAQGMVLWDPEGGENPHPITYIGDPRMVKLVAPEMVDIYPDYFKKYHDAGLRTGVCLRPTQVYMTPYTAAVDGEVKSRWSVQQFPQWIEVDLGETREIDRTELVCHADRAYQFKVEAKPQGGQYAVIVDRTENETGGSVDAPITDKFEPVKARYVRLTVTGAHGYDGDWCSIREFRVFAGESKNLALNNASDTSRKFGRTVGGHGTGSHNPDRNPLNDDFSEIWPEGVPWWRFFPIVERMSRKIAFAKENWGCTLFYVDTNGVHRPVGEDQQFKWTLLDNHIWRELHKRHPDVLLIPEFAANPGQMAYTTTYLQPPYSPPILRAWWRDLLPGAFGVSYTVNLKLEDWNELRPRLIRGIEAGDVMFFRGWFGDRYNKMIKTMYDEVYEQGAVNPGLPESYLERADDQ